MYEERDTERTTVPPALQAALSTLETDSRLDVLVDQIERVSPTVSRGRTASLLRGEWMGRALHPLLTDLPLGCWMSAGIVLMVVVSCELL
jgi:hypothetical protein